MGLGVRPTQALLHLPSPAFAPAAHVTQGTAGGLCLACPAPAGPRTTPGRWARRSWAGRCCAAALRPPLAPRVDAHCSASR